VSRLVGAGRVIHRAEPFSPAFAGPLERKGACFAPHAEGAGPQSTAATDATCHPIDKYFVKTAAKIMGAIHVRVDSTIQ